jgi:mannose-6-phosphate isomerase-like protein (cupin superfamily)
MNRKPILLPLVVVLIGLVGSTGPLLRASAQDDTAPVPDSWGVPGFEALSTLNDPSLAPGLVLELERLTWEPGFTIAMHTHPSSDAFFIVSGEVAWWVENGSAQITRAAVAGTPGPTETLEPGGEAVLRAGDAIIFDYPRTGMSHAARVNGDVPVVMLIATLYDPTKPLTVFVDKGGTPKP